MNAETRLAAALGTSAAPTRDPAFTLAVIRAAEANRFKAEAASAMLRWGALAGATACLLLALAGWTAANWAGVQAGLLNAGAIFALVAAARLMTKRLASVAVR